MLASAATTRGLGGDEKPTINGGSCCSVVLRRKIIFSISFILLCVFSSHQMENLAPYYLLDEEQSIPQIKIDDGGKFVSGDGKGCNRMLLYDTELVDKDTGVGHRLAYFSLASTVAAMTDSALALLEPPLEDERWAKFGGSPFGCPPTNRSYTNCDDKLPTGLSRIIRVPDKLSLGCTIPFNVTCTTRDDKMENGTVIIKIKTYEDWTGIARRTRRQIASRQYDFPEVFCRRGNNSNNVTVFAIGGVQLKNFWRGKLRPKFAQHFTDDSNFTNQRRIEWEEWMEDWSTRMGLTTQEVHEYTRETRGIVNNKKDNDSNFIVEYNPIDLVNAALNRAQVLTYQPWVERDLTRYMTKVDLPLTASFSSSANLRLSYDVDEGYDAMHIRRGDSLTTGQSIRSTEKYWVEQGFQARKNKTDHVSTLSIYHTNYVPFLKYWDEYITNYECSHRHWSTSLLSRKIYIATDDIITVKSEIANLTSDKGERGFWMVCNRSVEFIFNPQEEYATHLHQHLAPNYSSSKNDRSKTTDDGHEQYSRALAALADLQILSKSDVFVGDYRSYFSSLLRMLRTSFRDNRAYTKDIIIAWGGPNNDILLPWK